MMHVNGTYSVTPSPNNIYRALRAAADYIESHPQSLDFTNGNIPQWEWGGGLRCCPLARIGAFLNQDRMPGEKLYAYQQVPAFIGLGGPGVNGIHTFYSRMDQLSDTSFFNSFDAFNMGRHTDDSWANTPSICAKTLRAYAERYHNPGLPDSVTKLLRQGFLFDAEAVDA